MYAIAKLMTALLILSLSLSAPALAAPKPGEKPPVQREQAQTAEPGSAMHINMTAQFVFPSPGGRAVAQISNPEDSAGAMQYTLVIESSEIARVAGIDCGAEGDIALYASGEVPVGGSIEEISISPLPNGALLPEGVYKAYMLVKPLASEGMINAVFRTEVSVKVMADERTCALNADGMLDLAAHNATGKPARLELVVSAAALVSGGGPDVYTEGTGYKPEDTFVRLFQTDEIGPYESGAWRAVGLPDGQGLPEGNYECWLMRIEQDAEPYACARVQLSAAAQAPTETGDTEWMCAQRLSYAQAAVNGAYLLAMTEGKRYE